MSAKSKLAIGLLVVSAGLAIALCFRRDALQAPSPTLPDESLPRRLGGPPSPVALDHAPLNESRSPSAARAASLPTAISGGVPVVDERSNRAARGGNELRGRGILLKPIAVDDRALPADRTDGVKLSGGGAVGDARPVTHVIADGDTLARLAERYFGSDRQQRVIFELNRDILTSPDVLPIGKSLKIPPRSSVLHAAQAPPPDSEAPPPLTPLGAPSLE